LEFNFGERTDVGSLDVVDLIRSHQPTSAVPDRQYEDLPLADCDKHTVTTVEQLPHFVLRFVVLGSKTARLGAWYAKRSFSPAAVVASESQRPESRPGYNRQFRRCRVVHGRRTQL
jgi:hypothetical protein